MKSPKPTFAIGDRVKPLHQTSAMTHGVVVYCHGKHDKKNPRVRYATGWGVSSKAEDLIHLTPEEIASLPAPATIERDLQTEEEIVKAAYAKIGMPLRTAILG